MSKKQDQIAAQMLALYQQMLAKADTPSPYTQAVGGQALDVLNWAKGGDYRKPPTGIFYNFADPAERKKRRELEMGAGARGTAALGAPNPTALALDRQNREDESAQDEAKNFQEQVAGAIGGAGAVAGDLGAQEQANKLSILGSTGGLAQQGLEYQLRKRTPWWKSAINSFAQGAGQGAGAAAAA